MSRRRRIIFALLFSPPVLAAESGAPLRIPLYWLWNEGQTDSAYTVSAERRESLVRERGYADMGAIAYVDGSPAPHAKPLACFYAAAPHTDTFCSVSALEQRLVRALGYRDVGAEGFVHVNRVPGSVVLYRVSRAYGAGDGDREHRFAVSDEELVRLRKEGWTYDGAKGFVYPRP